MPRIIEIEDLRKLQNKYLKAKKAYYAGAPIMTDARFDKLEDELKSMVPDWKELQKTGTSVKKMKAKLVHYMPSLGKLYPEMFDKWYKKTKWEAIVLSNKLDGSAIQLEYDNGVPTKLTTRGDGEVGGDISFLIPYVNIPRKIEVKEHTVFRIEAIMEKDTFARKYAKDYDNARNLVAGILNRKLNRTESKQLADIDFIVLGIYGRYNHSGLKEAKNLGFLVTTHTIVNNEKRVLTGEKFVSRLEKRLEESEYEMDGLVLADANSIFEYETSDRPKWTIAFKKNTEVEDAHLATVKRIIWQTSHASRLIPKLEIEPVRIGGVTVKFATVHNAQWMVDRKIGIGAQIRIVRSGDVIPKIVEVVKPAKKLSLPEVAYKQVGVHFVATEESFDSETKIINRFLTTCGVERVALKTVQRLYETDKYDFFTSILGYCEFSAKSKTQQTEVLVDSQGFGRRQAAIFVEELAKIKSVTLVQAMVGSCVFDAGIGERRLTQIGDVIPLSMLLSLSRKELTAELTSIKGVGAKLSEQIIEGVSLFKPMLEVMSKYIDIDVPKTVAAKKPTKKGKYSGMRATWTGYRSKEQEEQWEANGGLIVPFGSKTTHLFYKQGGKKSSKVDKAGNKAFIWEKFVA